MALGVFSAITAGGAAIGLLLGGVLTEYASWRLVLFVNVPIAVVAVVGALRFLPESKDETAQGFDIPGAVLVTGGLTALVFGLVKLSDDNLSGGVKAGVFVLAAVLLTAFTVVQLRSRNPLVPFRLFRSKTLLGADLGSLFVGAGIFALFFFAVLWMQVVNGYGPIRSGLAFLPMTVLIGISAGVGAKLLGRTGPRPLLLAGMALAGTGMASLGLRLEPDSSYLTVVLPSLALVAAGMGMTFVSLTAAAIGGVDKADAGIASALLNAGQQVGGALGLAILTAVSTARTENLFPGIGQAQGELQRAFATGDVTTETTRLSSQVYDALVSGWSAGFLVAAGFLVIAGVVMGSLVSVSKQDAAAAFEDATPVG